MNKILTGRDEIENFVGRSWDRVIKGWIKDDSFPARKIQGRWESDMDLILAWRRRQIVDVNTSQPH